MEIMLFSHTEKKLKHCAARNGKDSKAEAVFKEQEHESGLGNVNQGCGGLLMILANLKNITGMSQ